MSFKEIYMFNLQESVFGIDLNILLDWVDPKLLRGTHYFYNVETRCFEFTRQYLKAVQNDTSVLFDPKVKLENMFTRFEGNDPVEGELRVVEELLQDGEADLPWLSKTVSFRGVLNCSNLNARHFPLDLEVLDISVASAMHTARPLVLRDPTLRKRFHLEHQYDASYKWFTADDPSEVMPHTWEMSRNVQAAFTVGEMHLVAVGSRQTQSRQEYRVDLLLRRQGYRYVMEFAIMTLQVLVAFASFWVPFNDDMLSHRMGITLTTLLTVVASTMQRPAIIEHLPYATMHDTWKQSLMLILVCVSIQNVVAFQTCWGSQPSEEWDEHLNTMTLEANQGRLFGVSWCGRQPWVGTSRLDFAMLLISTFMVVLVVLSGLVKAQQHRIAEILAMKRNVTLHEISKYSSLVLCHNGFKFLQHSDELGAAKHVALMPAVSLFMWVWSKAFKAKSLFTELLQIREPHQCSDHICPARDSGACRVQAHEKDREGLFPMVSLELQLCDKLHVVDVGTGEIGFYSFWVDEETWLVHMEGVSEDKLKYDEHSTFHLQFVESADGAKKLATEIVKRFRLDAVSSTGPSAEVSWCLTDVSVPGEVHHRFEPKLELEQPSDECRPVSEKLTLLLGLTGLNRETVCSDHTNENKLQTFCDDLNRMLPGDIECKVYVPRGSDEATYELWAAEWLVQHGDLEINQLRLCPAFRYLGRNGKNPLETTIEEVLDKYADLDAEGDLRVAFDRALHANCGCPVPASVVDRSMSPSPLCGLSEDAHSFVPKSTPCQSDERGARQQPVVSADAFYEAFEESPALLRAVTRVKLFIGTLSAGGGSCQVTLRGLRGAAPTLQSVPLGNRTPVVDGRTGTGAWTPARVRAWTDVVNEYLNKHQVVTGQRGLFLGITAVYYAAKAVHVDGLLLERDEFLSALTSSIDKALEEEGHDESYIRLVSNLTLVKALVKHVLHRTATIVCKRNWLSGGREFVATWTLGLYLKHGPTEASPRFLRGRKLLHTSRSRPRKYLLN